MTPGIIAFVASMLALVGLLYLYNKVSLLFKCLQQSHDIIALAIQAIAHRLDGLEGKKPTAGFVSECKCKPGVDKDDK